MRSNKFCAECGAELKITDKFCTLCGKGCKIKKLLVEDKVRVKENMIKEIENFEGKLAKENYIIEGIKFMNGVGGKRDYGKAIEIFKRELKTGNQDAEIWIALASIYSSMDLFRNILEKRFIHKSKKSENQREADDSAKTSYGQALGLAAGGVTGALLSHQKPLEVSSNEHGENLSSTTVPSVADETTLPDSSDDGISDIAEDIGDSSLLEDEDLLGELFDFF